MLSVSYHRLACSLTVLLVAAGLPSFRAQVPGGGAISIDVLFELLDRDGDGRISRQEATRNYASRFSQWDADGDGFATRKEIHEFRRGLGIDDRGERTTGIGPRGVTAAAAAPARGSRSQGSVAAVAGASILKEPTDWRLETMSIPPGFAPDIRYTGAEEIRFAPGMFDPASANYFTCVLAITVENAPTFGRADLEDFLGKYYRGLSVGLARRKGLKVDPAKMRAEVRPAVGDAGDQFRGEVVFFDSFNEGRRITLNVEAQVVARSSTRNTVLLVLVSPSVKESTAWTTLREIGRKIIAVISSAKDEKNHPAAGPTPPR